MVNDGEQSGNCLIPHRLSGEAEQLTVPRSFTYGTCRGCAKTARSRCRWSVSGGRSCGTLRECHRLVDGASGRLVGVRDCSATCVSAAADARVVPQPVVWPHAAGHAQPTAGAIETGRAAGEGVLGLARADRPRQHVTLRHGAGRPHQQHARSIGQAAMVRRSRPGHFADVFTGRAQRQVAVALTVGQLSPCNLRAVLGGGSK